MTRKNLLSKRIFSIILSLAVALSMMPATAFAETSIVENAVAKVTMTASDGAMWTGEYTDLLDAFKAARKGDFEDSSGTSAKRVEVKLLESGETYTLQSDENFPISFEFGHSITVDLNGCTLKRSVSAANQGILTVKGRANVTLKNGKLDLTVSTNTPKAINMPNNEDTPTLTLEEDMTINVTGTTYEDPFDTSVKSYTGTAIYAGGGNLNIKGGTYGEVQIHSANVKLSGGNYTEVEHLFDKYAEMLETGYIFAKQDDSSYIDPSTMSNEVGKDDNIKNIMVIKCEHQGAPFTDGKCGHCGYICTKHMFKSGDCGTCGRKLVASDGTNYYVSLNEAFEQVANGGEIWALPDLPEETLTFNNNKEVTLELYNSPVKGSADDAATLTVDNGKLTIINGIPGSDAVDYPAVITNNGKGFAVCVTGGTLKFGGKATLTGGLQVIKDGNLEGGLKEGSILIVGTGNAMDGGSASSVSVRDSVNNQNYGVVRDLLGEGLAFAKYDKSAQTTGDIVSGNEPNLTEDVIVVEHTQHTIDKSTHKCACGWECDHPSDSVDSATGICSQCDAQMAVALITGEGTSYSTNARDTVNNAPKDSTVKLYADTDESMRLYPNNSITLDANHHSIGDLYLDFTSVTVRNAPVISKLTVKKSNKMAVLENCNVQSSLTTVVTIDSPLTMKGGSLQGYISMDNNGKLTLEDGVTLKSSLRFWNGSELITKLTQGTFLRNNNMQSYSISVESSSKYTNVCELLADGYAFAKYDSATESKTDEIVNGYVAKLTEDVIVVAHPQHTFKNVSGEYVCDCGAKHEEHELDKDGKCMQCDYVCPHTDVNDATGKCNTCPAAMAAKVTLGEATTYYTDVNKAITSAADGSTVTVISEALQQSISQNTAVPANAAITLDLNGHTLSGYALKVDAESSELTVIDSSKGNGRIGLSIWRGTLIFNPGNKKTMISQLNVYGGNVKLYGGRIESKNNLTWGTDIKMNNLLPEGYAYRFYFGESMYESLDYMKAAENDLNGWESAYNLVPELCDHTKLESDFNEADCPYCNSALAATVTKDSKTTGYTTAQNAVDNANDGTVKLLENVSETLTISSAFKLDCNGHTITKLTVSEGVTLASLLPEGYAFKSEGTWVSDLSAKTLDNVTNEEAPVKSVTAVGNSSITVPYGTDFTLAVEIAWTGDSDNNNNTFKWTETTTTGYELASNRLTLTDYPDKSRTFNITISKDNHYPAKSGTYTYWATFTKDGYSKSCEFTVTIGQKNLTDVMVGTIADQTYNGSAQTPALTVKDSDKTLTNGKDYTVAYADNTNAGEATATITGQGNYTGQVVKKFTIKQKALSADDITVADGGTYDGNAKKPEVTVKDGDKTLTAGTDYTLSYADNINAGENTAKVTVTGKGNYSGEVVKNFSIAKAVEKTVIPTDEYIFYELARTYTFNSPAVPDDCGNVSYRLDIVDVPKYYESGASIDSETGILTLPIIYAAPPMSGGVVGTVTIIAVTDNYEDISLTISVIGKYKITITGGAPTLSSAVLTYGEALNTITLSGSMKAKDKTVEGTFSWQDGTRKPDVGTYSAKWTFTPNEPEYRTATGTATITVNAAKLTGVSVSQTGTLEYTGEQQAATVQTSATAANDQKVTFTYSDTENGTYDAAIPKFTDAGEHRVYYKAEAANHEDSYGSFIVTIAKAAVTTDKPVQNTVYAGTEVSKVTFKENKVTVSFNNGTRELEGTWSVAAKDGATKFDKAGKYTCEATFTPNDENFAPIIMDVEITVTNRPSGGGSLPRTEVVTIDKVTTSPAEVKNETKTDADGNKETISKITVSDANQKEIIKQVKDNKSEEIVINVSEKEVADNAKLDISLDKDFIDSIIKDTDAKLTIKTPEGDKTFTQEELKKLVETAEGGKVTIDSSVFEEPTEPTEPSGAVTPAQKKIAKGVKATEITIKAVRTKSGKIRLTWTKSKGYKVDYFEVYRSTKKNSGYGKKPFFTTKSGDVSKYLNTKNLKTGKTYYYKVRGVRVINGKKYYTGYSNKTWKKIK